MAYSKAFNVAEPIELEAILNEEEQNQKKVSSVGMFEKEYERLVKQLRAMKRILDDAGHAILTNKMATEMEDALDEWHEEMERQVNDAHEQKLSMEIKDGYTQKLFRCFSSKKQVPHHHHHHQVIPIEILNLEKQLDDILKKKNINDLDMSRRYIDDLTQFSRPIEIYERHEHREDLVRKLITRSGDSTAELICEDRDYCTLCIVGKTGVGKTTLARIVYDDARVEEFFELRVWISVSDCGGIEKGIIKWLRDLTSDIDVDVALERFKYFITGKKCLLVLDDADYRECELVETFLGLGGAGSKILVTTGLTEFRSYYINLKELSSHACGCLVYETAGPGGGWRIAEMLGNICSGLPLNALFLGGFLGLKTYFQVPEVELEEVIRQSTEERYIKMFPLRLIYEALPPTLQDCFSYFSIFPLHDEIDAERLIQCWAARGYLGPDFQKVGRQYVEFLATFSIFTDLERSNDDEGQIKRFKIHHVVRDFVRNMYLGLEARGTRVSTCQSCGSSLDSYVIKDRSLFITREDELPPDRCKHCFAILRILSLRGINFQSMAQEIENMIRLRWLELSEIKLSRDDTKTVCKLYKLQFLKLSCCNLKEIPSEIGNLSGLLSLDLSFNYFLKELPESICCLVELRALNLDSCHSFSKLPRGIHKLINLEHLHNNDAHFLFKFPQGLGSLTSLRTLTKFHGGRHLNELKLLGNLESLTGSLELHIRLTNDLLKDASEAKLKDKQGIRYLKITFYDYMDGKESSLRTEIIDALKPHEGLQKLEIRDSNGSTLPSWIISPQNQLRYLVLSCFSHLVSLPPLGKLPHLEELRIDQMFGLEYVGPEFLGITTRETVSAASNNHDVISFPKLKKLIFTDCPNWEEWEDISTEELQIMPCLTVLSIKSCHMLRNLPLRLLHKAFSLKVLGVSGSIQLEPDIEEARKSIPRLWILSRFSQSY